MPMANITPDTSIVTSWSNQLPHWATILSELVDNAFDADATQVTLTVERDRLRIDDNGVGCPDLALMMTAGKNLRHPTTRLGRYGIGFKQAVSSAGRSLHITSVHQGILRRCSLDWEQLARSGVWSIALEDPVPTHEPQGTHLVISHLRNKQGLSPGQIRTLAAKLSETYAPALMQGRQIALIVHNRPALLQASQLPSLEHMKRVELLVGRKRAHLQIGLVPEGEPCPRSGLMVGYGFRIIKHGVRWGLGQEPTPGLLGWLYLLDGWNLSTNKEHVLDEDQEHLEKLIAERCADVIARAVQRGYVIPVHGANGLLESVWHSVNAAARAKEKRRAPQHPSGPVDPRHTPRRRQHATLEQPGDAFPARKLKTPPLAGIRIGMGHLGVDGGLYDCQDNGIVELNLDNHIIASAHQDQRLLAIIALHATAISLVLQPERQQRILFPRDPEQRLEEQISQLANQLLAHLPTLNTPEEP